MPEQITCEADKFALGMKELLGDIQPDISKEMAVAVPKVARKGAKMLREDASARWTGKTGQTYAKGFSSRTDKTGVVTTAEIGNKAMPGLVHLLEKGHETLTGSRRVEGIKHVEPVYDALVPQLEKAVSDAVGKALKN